MCNLELIGYNDKWPPCHFVVPTGKGEFCVLYAILSATGNAAFIPIFQTKQLRLVSVLANLILTIVV